jgi:hypothetical protein
MDDTKVLQQDEYELNEPKDHQFLVDLVHHADVGWAGFRLRSDGWSGTTSAAEQAARTGRVRAHLFFDG